MRARCTGSAPRRSAAVPEARSLRDLDDEFAQLVAGREPAEGVRCMVERHHRVDTRPQLARGGELHDGREFRTAPHGGAKQGPLVPVEPAYVERDMWPGGGAAGDEPPAAPQGTQR